MTKKLKIQLFILTISFFIFSCEEKFNLQKWNEKNVDWQISDVRENMIEDLINSKVLINKDTSQILQMFGEPETKESNSFHYLVREKYGLNIDPEYVSYLAIEFDKNNKVKDYYLLVSQ